MKSIKYLFFLIPIFFLGAQEPKNSPNIILIMVDDLGAECLNSYGGTSYNLSLIHI